ncbi:MAG: hypothetical protein Q4Q19_01940 [Methanobrevibacter sp.]|nr:hypothetical protein [Methanobrevibacter sp.]
MGNLNGSYWFAVIILMRLGNLNSSLWSVVINYYMICRNGVGRF